MLYNGFLINLTGPFLNETLWLQQKMCSDWYKTPGSGQIKIPIMLHGFTVWQCGLESFNLYCSYWKTSCSLLVGWQHKEPMGSCGDTVNHHTINIGFHMVTFHGSCCVSLQCSLFPPWAYWVLIILRMETVPERSCSLFSCHLLQRTKHEWKYKTGTCYHSPSTGHNIKPTKKTTVCFL